MADDPAQQWLATRSGDYGLQRLCGNNDGSQSTRRDQELQYLFGFITERISNKTEKGRVLSWATFYWLARKAPFSCLLGQDLLAYCVRQYNSNLCISAMTWMTRHLIGRTASSTGIQMYTFGVFALLCVGPIWWDHFTHAAQVHRNNPNTKSSNHSDDT